MRGFSMNSNGPFLYLYLEFEVKKRKVTCIRLHNVDWFQHQMIGNLTQQLLRALFCALLEWYIIAESLPKHVW